MWVKTVDVPRLSTLSIGSFTLAPHPAMLSRFSIQRHARRCALGMELAHMELASANRIDVVPTASCCPACLMKRAAREAFATTALVVASQAGMELLARLKLVLWIVMAVACAVRLPILLILAD